MPIRNTFRPAGSRRALAGSGDGPPASSIKSELYKRLRPPTEAAPCNLN